METNVAVALRVFPMEKSADEPDITRTIVHMPAGSKPCGLVKTHNGVGICVVLPAIVGPRVPHALQVAPADVIVEPLLGRRFGEPIGILNYGAQPFAVMPDLPWPEVKADA